MIAAMCSALTGREKNCQLCVVSPTNVLRDAAIGWTESGDRQEHPD
jgi:hypothetical protein